MAGSISFSQPGGAGSMGAGGTAIIGSRVYPTFIGATTTTWTWTLLAVPAGSTETLSRGTLPDPSFPVGFLGQYTLSFVDSNGVTYIATISAADAGGLDEGPWSDT